MFILRKNRIKTVVFTLIFTIFISASAAADDLVCGAYISKSGLDIADYEALCGVKNSIYLIGVQKTYPKDKILECYANGKIPMLIISRNIRFSSLPEIADAAGEYDLPMYICIAGDTEYFKLCVGIFRARCKNIKFVQPVMLSDTDYEFVGCDYADYIAITATFTEKNRDVGSLYNAVEQADVPVMLDLAVSRYSENGHQYTTFDAIKDLSYVYNIKTAFPDKLFGINYINITSGGRKFDVYGDKKIRTVYGGLVCKYGTEYGLNDF